MRYIAKYYLLDLEVTAEGKQWKAQAKDQIRTTLLENRYETAEQAQYAAIIVADGHLQKHYSEVTFKSLDPAQVIWRWQ